MIRQSATGYMCYSTNSQDTKERIYKKFKTVWTENRCYQLENFPSSLCNKCQTNIKNRFRVQILLKKRKIIGSSLSDDQMEIDGELDSDKEDT